MHPRPLYRAPAPCRAMDGMVIMVIDRGWLMAGADEAVAGRPADGGCVLC